MKQIPLTQGQFALVDDEDYEMLSKFKWTLHKRGDHCYAIRMGRKENGQRLMIKMHRQVLGLTDPKILVDHRDNNGLNNQKANIRACSPAENSRNRGLTKSNPRKLKGITFHKGANKFMAQIEFERKSIFIGYFNTDMEAAKAYDKKAIELHGDFARLNFP